MPVNRRQDGFIVIEQPHGKRDTRCRMGSRDITAYDDAMRLAGGVAPRP